MKIQAIRTFYSRKLKRVVKKDEVVLGSEGWCNAISNEKLGVIVDKRKRRTKKIKGQKVETASLESGEQS